MAKGKSKSNKSRAEAEPKEPGQKGRAPAVIDLEQLAELASIQCTHDEAAGVLKVDRRTLQRRLADDPIAAEAWEQGRASGKESLRRVQWRLAMRGHPTMLIWLGKQTLGQKDRHELSFSDETLKAMSDEQLARIAAGEDPVRVMATTRAPEQSDAPPVN